ncbi:MAG: hypothetical protein HFF93_00735 [Oscillibacter sp.]|nr:hypothetical protein [Oscillibacter sp.]
MRFLRKLFRGCWHLMWACVPGCGQMCQGYMKRGISQTIIATALLFIAVFLEMGVLAVLIAPLWLYSFFDSFNLRRQIRDGLAPEDEFMFGMSEMDSRKLSRILSRRGSLIGWVLVAVGLYNVYQIFARRLSQGGTSQNEIHPLDGGGGTVPPGAGAPGPGGPGGARAGDPGVEIGIQCGEVRKGACGKEGGGP